MIHELVEIKKVRKNYGLTQADLAKISGVSQSLIAKIEAGRIDPTYSKTQQIFRAIESMSKTKEKNAAEIMQKQVISVEPESSIKDAIRKMKKYAISQMPILSGNICHGTITETIILEALMEGKENKVKEIMEDVPPTVSKNTPIGILSSLLKSYDIILVSDEGKIKGVITKADLIKSL